MPNENQPPAAPTPTAPPAAAPPAAPAPTTSVPYERFQALHANHATLTQQWNEAQPKLQQLATMETQLTAAQQQAAQAQTALERFSQLPAPLRTTDHLSGFSAHYDSYAAQQQAAQQPVVEFGAWLADVAPHNTFMAPIFAALGAPPASPPPAAPGAPPAAAPVPPAAPPVASPPAPPLAVNPDGTTVPTPPPQAKLTPAQLDAHLSQMPPAERTVWVEANAEKYGISPSIVAMFKRSA